MSGRGAAAALSARWRLLLVAALLGLAAGFAWGISDQPRYEATATLGVESAGRGQDSQAELQRLAALAGSEEVATRAAGILGDDVAGADLLSEVSAAPGAGGATVEITATSELPDFAAATADAFAAGLSEVAAERANESYKRATERLEEKLAELDPDSAAAAEVGDRIADLEEARADDPLSPGAAAAQPQDPIENRPAALGAILGGLAGLLVGAIAALLLGRPRRRADEAASAPRSELAAEDGTEPEQEPGVEPSTPIEPAEAEPAEAGGATLLADELGVPVIARLEAPSEAVEVADGRPMVGTRAALALERAAEAAGLFELDAPRTLAVLATSGAGAAPAAVGLGLAVAEDGKRVLIVDADLRSGAVADLLGVDPGPGIADYLAGRAGPRDVLRTLRLAAAGEAPVPIVCVPAGSAGGASIAGERFEALADRLPRVYDLVVFVGPELGGEGAAEAGRLIELTEETVLAVPDDEGVSAAGHLGRERRERVAGLISTGA